MIPIRSSTAPRTRVAVASIPITWNPSPVKDIGLKLPSGRPIRVPVGMLLKIPRLTPAGFIAGYIGTAIAQEAGKYVLALAGGLKFEFFCNFGSITGGWTGGFPATCHRLNAVGVPFMDMLRGLQALSPGTLVYRDSLMPTVPGSSRYKSVSKFSYLARGARYTRPLPGYLPYPITGAPPRASDPPFAFIPTPRPIRVWHGNVPVSNIQRGNDVPAGLNNPWLTRDRSNGFIDGTRGWVWNPPQVENPPYYPPIPGNPPRTVPRSTYNTLSQSQVRTAVNSMTKEVKWGAKTGVANLFFATVKVREALSEYGDLLDVVFKSLPRPIQRIYGGKHATTLDKIEALWNHGELIDPVLMMQNYIANHIEDEIIGRTWFTSQKHIRDAVFGNSMGSLGPPGENPAFTEYAKAVSKVANELASLLMGQRMAINRKTAEDYYADAYSELDRLTKKYAPRITSVTGHSRS